VALAGEDANVEIALARSLVERMDEGDARRMWNKVVNLPPTIPLPTILPFRKRRENQPLLIPAGDASRACAGMLF
jgi:hypothetical protein